MDITSTSPVSCSTARLSHLELGFRTRPPVRPINADCARRCSTAHRLVQDYVSDTSSTWLGYYPVGSGSGQIPFDLINAGACDTHWYGEAFDSAPTSWHDGDLGNGILGPSAGSFAFVEMLIQTSSNVFWFDGTGTATGCLVLRYDRHAEQRLDQLVQFRRPRR